ncbi:hypothetical protein B9Z55_017331 [Caenorhabditis nigoni]|nr:hypothetical protein B9Z55_017331 [Caenorhabditis nigoni]
MRTSSTNSIMIGIAICDLIILYENVYERVQSYWFYGSQNPCMNKSNYWYTYSLLIGDFLLTSFERASFWLGVFLAFTRFVIMKKAGIELNISKPLFGCLLVLVLVCLSSAHSAYYYGGYSIDPWGTWTPKEMCTGYPANYSEPTFYRNFADNENLSKIFRRYQVIDGVSRILVSIFYPILAILLIFKIRKSAKFVSKALNSKSSEERLRTCRLILVMTIFYVIASAPSGVSEYVQFFVDIKSSSILALLVGYGSILLFCLNASSHGIINFTMSSKYRQTVKKFLGMEKQRQGNMVLVSIAAPVQREECCLVLDFGKKVHDFLSVFIVFIDRTSEKPTLKSLPFMFAPVFNTLCSCHSLQKSAERVLDPLDESCHEFDSEELSHLREIFEAVDDCGDLASRLRRHKNHHDLEKLPVGYCKTRWMTFVNCTQDIIEMFPKIDRIENAFIEKYCEKIRPKLPNLITTMQILKVYEKPLKVLEETHMRIHEVAPWLFKLRAYFEEQEKKGIQDRDYTKSTVSKSACISLNHYISKTISDPHLLASLLCPGMRSLSLFPQTYKDKALKLLKEELELIKLEPKDQEIAEFDNLTKDLYDAPPPAPSASSELQDYQTSIFSNSDIVAPPIEFWHKHENRFPRLAKVAGSVFCTLSSESICERAFSALNRVFRNDRQSLEPEMVEILMVSYLYLNSST